MPVTARKKTRSAAKPVAKKKVKLRVVKKTATRKTAAKKAPARKPAARKTVAKKAPARKPAARKTVAKKAPAKKGSINIGRDGLRTKSDLFNTLAERAELSKKDIANVFDALGDIIDAHIKKRGPGKMSIPGMMKIEVKVRPATKARRGINPFTKEETTFKAKPASRRVKITALKKLKDMAK